MLEGYLQRESKKEIEEDGSDVIGMKAGIEELMAKGKRPKFIYVVPDFQNPSGITTSLEKRQALLSLSQKHGIPLIYDAHEIWGYMVRADLPKIWANYYLWKEKHLIKNVDKIITVSKVIKNYFEKISDKPVIAVMNCKTLIGTKYEPSKNKKFVLLYLGSLSKIRFGLGFIDVFRELSDVHCNEKF